MDTNTKVDLQILTVEEVAKFNDAELALALKATAIGCGDLEMSRVINEAAKRLSESD